MFFPHAGKLSIAFPKEVVIMPQKGMSKKLRQAVQHANETTPSSRANTEPHTSKTVKTKSNR
jgi:hypothetical protein